MEKAEPSRTDQNSGEPIRGRRLFLFLSLGLNLALLLFLASIWRRPEAATAIPLPDSTKRTSERIHARRIAIASPWSQLESTELAVYAANLRAAGCPKKTVRDILLPLLEEKFALPASADFEPTNFWASFSQRQSAATARAAQERALEKEKNKTLEELLGFKWVSKGLKQAHAGAAGSIGFLDFERAEKFLCVAERFKTQFSRGDGSRRFDRPAAIHQAWRQELGEILSPTELEETELRDIFVTFQRRNPNLHKAGLNGSELRQLMTFRRELNDPLPSALLAGDDQLIHELDFAGEQQFHAKARRLLGDNRFIDYLKGCDPCIEKTLATLEKEFLPRSFALELFDFRQEAMTQAQRIRQMPVRRSEKRAHLAALRQSALEQLAALPNAATENPVLEIIRDWLPDDTRQIPSADKALLEINRDWLQEIANP